jgi:hypothetical protein
LQDDGQQLAKPYNTDIHLHDNLKKIRVHLDRISDGLRLTDSGWAIRVALLPC